VSSEYFLFFFCAREENFFYLQLRQISFSRVVNLFLRGSTVVVAARAGEERRVDG
jgi:hypothetical protein